jgi:ADP-ribose pyrophosphatase
MKRYRKINQLTWNSFLNLYEMEAFATSGKEFRYYFVSRRKNEELKVYTKSVEPEGVVIYPILKENPEKLVLIKQYRYPIDEYIYELPAGMIETGETPAQAAVREMKEETGFDFEPYEGGEAAFRKPLFMGVGFTDETSCTVFGYVSGTITNLLQEDTESIQVVIVDKKEALRILREERISIRLAFQLQSFLQANPEEPFQFLTIEK